MAQMTAINLPIEHYGEGVVVGINKDDIWYVSVDSDGDTLVHLHKPIKIWSPKVGRIMHVAHLIVEMDVKQFVVGMNRGYH